MRNHTRVQLVETSNSIELTMRVKLRVIKGEVYPIVTKVSGGPA